jgi:hypothetical protein
LIQLIDPATCVLCRPSPLSTPLNHNFPLPHLLATVPWLLLGCFPHFPHSSSTPQHMVLVTLPLLAPGRRPSTNTA